MYENVGKDSSKMPLCFFRTPNRLFSLHAGETQKLHRLWTGLLIIGFLCQKWTYKNTCREAIVAIIG